MRQSQEASNYLEKILDRLKDIKGTAEDSVSIDDNEDSLTIDTDDGPIDITGNIQVTDDLGDSQFDQIFSVAPNTTDTVVTRNVSQDEAVSGFTGNGESDAKWKLYINGDEKASQWTNQANPNADFVFDAAIEVGSGDTVTLEVENIGLNTADYEGAIQVVFQ